MKPTLNNKTKKGGQKTTKSRGGSKTTSSKKIPNGFPENGYFG